MRSSIHLSAVGLAFLLASASPLRAGVLVFGTITPEVGSFHYELSVENTGPEDITLVTLDAPVGDPLIAPSLTTPVDFIGSYDGGLGLLDFIEDTDFFAAGTTTPGFSFDTMAGPGDAFTTFNALGTLGDTFSGPVTYTVVPEPRRVAFGGGLALLALAFLRHFRRPQPNPAS
jgi:hypothetical protein